MAKQKFARVVLHVDDDGAEYSPAIVWTLESGDPGYVAGVRFVAETSDGDQFRFRDKPTTLAFLDHERLVQVRAKHMRILRRGAAAG